MNTTSETIRGSREAETETIPASSGERTAPPTRLLQILKALEGEAASDVHDILRRSRATNR